MSTPLRIPVNLLIEMNPKQVDVFARQHGLDPDDRPAILEKVTAVVANRAAGDTERLWAVERRSARNQGGV